MGGSFFFLFSSFRLDSFLRFTSCIFQFKLCVILIVFSFPRASSRTNSRSLKPNRVQSFHGECSCRLRLFSIEPRNKRPLTSRFWRFSFAEIFSLFEKTVVFLPPPPVPSTLSLTRENYPLENFSFRSEIIKLRSYSTRVVCSSVIFSCGFFFRSVCWAKFNLL